MRSYDEWILSLTNSQRQFINDGFRKKNITKWSPVIEDYFGGMNFNKDLMEYICFYAETYSMYEDQLPQFAWSSALSVPPPGMITSNVSQQSNLRDRIEEIKQSIIELNKNRKSIIVRKVFNYETGHAEYELEDGNFVKILPSGKLEPPKIDTFSVLPKSLIKLLNPQEYREEQLNTILDDNR